jgi:hypothetical protein
MPKSQAPRKRVKSPEKPKVNKNQIMDDLKSIDSECQSMLSETARFSPYLTNRDLVEAGDIEQIHDNSKILSRDTMQMKAELDSIREATPKRIHPDNPNHVMKGLSIGDRYNEWQEKYQRAILPTLERLGDLLKDAALKLDQKKEVKSDDNA